MVPRALNVMQIEAQDRAPRLAYYPELHPRLIQRVASRFIDGRHSALHFGWTVADLVKDPRAAGWLTTSTTLWNQVDLFLLKSLNPLDRFLQVLDRVGVAET